MLFRSERTYAVILVTDNNVKNKLLRLPVPLEQDEAQILTTALNRALREGSLPMLAAGLMTMATRAPAAALVAAQVAEMIEDVEGIGHTADVHVEGASKLLQNREYQDPQKARDILDYLSDRSKIWELVQTGVPYTVNVRIGPETGEPRLSDSSFVFTAYDIDEQTRGVVGVVGPVRMDYAPTVARLTAIAKQLSRLATGDNVKYKLKKPGEKDGQ